jgi:hypothetical protein
MKDESYGLYGYQLSEIGEEPFSVKELHDESKGDVMQNISKFWWSPDSKRIAFLAPDEKDVGKNGEVSGDDVEVFGSWKYTRPYIFTFETFEVKELYNKNA